MGSVHPKQLSGAVLAQMEHTALEQYEHAPVGFLCTSVDGWIGKVNATLLSWLGYDKAEMVGQMRFLDLIGPGARIFFDTQHSTLLLLQGRVNDIAVDLRARDGTQVPVLVNSVLQRDAAGQPQLVQMSLFNASERRRYERELLHAKRQAEHAAVTLDQRVTERTSQLAEALDQAEAAVRAKNDFLANMSHEIRTPLNAILGMAHLALERVSASPERDYLQNIVGAGNNVVQIVSEILDFCKMDAGKLEIEALPLSLHDLIHRTAADFAGQARAKGLDFGIEIDAAIPREVMGDALRLSQILANYIGNAVKFTEQGAIGVHARLVRREQHGVRVRVEVRDTGIGVAAAKQAGLFQAFQQGDSSITRKYGGTGLGLAICRQLAEVMEGCVGLQSGAGGSTFWFEVVLALPAGAQGGADAPDAGAHDDDAAPDLACLAGARVLLAEDNPLNQELTRLLLERVGAHITIAGNGALALAALADATFDCVLMDVQMPVMDGCSATRALRADPCHAGLPVVALTANVFNSARAECLAAGMDDFLVKPIDAEHLYRKLAHWIGARGRVQGLPPEPAHPLPAPAPAPAESAATLSLSVLGALVDHDPDMMAHLLAIFFDNADATCAELAQALAGGDLTGANALGHRLKSSARAVGAMGLADLCLALEDAVTLPEAAALHEQIPPTLVRLRAQAADEAPAFATHAPSLS